MPFDSLQSVLRPLVRASTGILSSLASTLRTTLGVYLIRFASLPERLFALWERIDERERLGDFDDMIVSYLGRWVASRTGHTIQQYKYPRGIRCVT